MCFCDSFSSRDLSSKITRELTPHNIWGMYVRMLNVFLGYTSPRLTRDVRPCKSRNGNRKLIRTSLQIGGVTSCEMRGYFCQRFPPAVIRTPAISPSASVLCRTTSSPPGFLFCSYVRCVTRRVRLFLVLFLFVCNISKCVQQSKPADLIPCERPVFE
jgi:hypothetical protein